MVRRARIAKSSADGAPARRRQFAETSRLALRFGPRPAANLAVVVAASLVTGIGEAALLYLVVQSASAITAGVDAVDVAVGPIQADDVPLNDLLRGSAVLLACLLAVATVVAWRGAVLSSGAQLRLRRRLTDAYFAASWERQADEKVGALQELLSTHMVHLNSAIQHTVTALTALLSFLAFFASAVVLSPRASAALIVAAALLAALMAPIRRRLRHASETTRERNSAFALEATEGAGLAREVRTFGVVAPVSTRLARSAASAASATKRLWFFARIQPAIYQYSALALVIVAVALSQSASTDEVTQLGAVVLILVRSLTYSQQFNNAMQGLNQAHPYVRGLDDAVGSFDAVAVREGTTPMPEAGDVVLDDVRYAYGDGPEVLRGVSLDVRDGECIGIVGPSGSGKTTLVQILLGLRRPTGGTVSVGGVDVASIAPASWSANVSAVPQDNVLLTGSVLENVDFHRGLPEERLVAALDEAHLLDDVLALPDGTATPLGRGSGVDLSGGQRQRLGLARALASHPRMVVLDEPTSALDMRSEERVQQTLTELKGNVTMFIVAHRVSTMSVCDRIVVLRDGCVEAFGPPDEVAAVSRFFAEAVRLAGTSDSLRLAAGG